MILKTVKIGYCKPPRGFIGNLERFFKKYEDLKFKLIQVNSSDKESDYDYIISKDLSSKDRPKGKNVILIVDPNTRYRNISQYIGDYLDIWVNDCFISQRINSFLSAIRDQYALEYTKNTLQTTIDTSSDLIWHKSVNGIHLLVNNTFCDAVGKKPYNIVGKDHYEVWNVKKPDYEEDKYICVTSEDVVCEKGCYCSFDEDVKIRNSMHRFFTGKSPIFNLDGDIVATAGVGKDVTADKMHKKALEKLAMTDVLTETYNRTYIKEQVKSKMDVYGIAFLDINYFKEINDKLGHDIGDIILSQVALFIQKYMSSDIIARWGGDEFIVIRTFPVDYNEFYEEVIDLIYRINLKISVLDKGIGSSISAGISVTDDPKSKSFEDLIEIADKEMYKMKKEIHKLDGKGLR